MDVIEVLVPQGHEQAAQGQSQEIHPFLHPGAQEKVHRQQYQSAAEGQREQVVAALEGLDVFRAGEIGGLNEAPIPVDKVGILIDNLDLTILTGKQGDGHIVHLRHGSLSVV